MAIEAETVLVFQHQSRKPLPGRSALIATVYIFVAGLSSVGYAFAILGGTFPRSPIAHTIQARAGRPSQQGRLLLYRHRNAGRGSLDAERPARQAAQGIFVMIL